MLIKRFKWLSVVTVLLLAACAARQTQTYDTYGNVVYSITCNVAERQLCLDQANKTCPRGYYLVDEDDSGTFFNSILIRCKG